jgi:hypothetical protein
MNNRKPKRKVNQKGGIIRWMDDMAAGIAKLGKPVVYKTADWMAKKEMSAADYKKMKARRAKRGEREEREQEEQEWRKQKNRRVGESHGQKKHLNGSVIKDNFFVNNYCCC